MFIISQSFFFGKVEDSALVGKRKQLSNAKQAPTSKKRKIGIVHIVFPLVKTCIFSLVKGSSGESDSDSDSSEEEEEEEEEQDTKATKVMKQAVPKTPDVNGIGSEPLVVKVCLFSHGLFWIDFYGKK